MTASEPPVAQPDPVLAAKWAAMTPEARIEAKEGLAYGFAALCRKIEAEHRAKQAEEAAAVREAAA